MKKTILIISLTILSLAGMAQTKVDTVYIKLNKNDLAGIQQVFGFAFQWIPKSQATGIDIENFKTAVQHYYPMLVADTTKKQPIIKPVIKK